MAAWAAIEIRRDDFRVGRLQARSEHHHHFRRRRERQSQALNRLAEAKGAVELLLAESYVRRDQRGAAGVPGPGRASLLLPPTRSLVRAKRSLVGNCRAAAARHWPRVSDAGADALADSVRRRGGMPTLVFLTDGRANVAL